MTTEHENLKEEYFDKFVDREKWKYDIHYFKEVEVQLAWIQSKLEQESAKARKDEREKVTKDILKLWEQNLINAENPQSIPIKFSKFKKLYLDALKPKEEKWRNY